MTVYDLTPDQLLELKESYFYDDGKSDIRLNDVYYYFDVPDEIIFEQYEGINFVNDDFCCSAGV